MHPETPRSVAASRIGFGSYARPAIWVAPSVRLWGRGRVDRCVTRMPWRKMPTNGTAHRIDPGVGLDRWAAAGRAHAALLLAPLLPPRRALRR